MQQQTVKKQADHKATTRHDAKTPSPVHERRLAELHQTLGNHGVLRQGDPMIQAKLRVSPPGDRYEWEADRVAERVMRIPEPQTLRQSNGRASSLQSRPIAGQITPLVQRQTDDEPSEAEEEREEVEETEEEELIWAKRKYARTPTVAPGVSAQIAVLRGGGRPLPSPIRALFEPRFGRDFRGVRVHTGTRAVATTRALNARAFTVGRDVVFGAGQYAPETDRGKRLLAHELTHVIQQNGHTDHVMRQAGPRTRNRPRSRGARRKPISYRRATKWNRYYWHRLYLADVKPFGSITPMNAPMAYANKTYEFQANYNRLQASRPRSKRQRLTRDGILGPRTMTKMGILAYLTKDPKNAALFKRQGFDLDTLARLKRMMGKKAFSTTWMATIAHIKKPKIVVRWRQRLKSASALSYFEQFRLLGDAGRRIFDNHFSRGKRPAKITDADRFAIMRRAYAGRTFSGLLALYRVNRSVIHIHDITDITQRYWPSRRRYEYALYSGRARWKDVQTVIARLSIKVPETRRARTALAEIRGTGGGKARRSRTTALAFTYYIPSIPESAKKAAVAAHLAGKMALQEASAAWLQKFGKEVQQRLKGTPDITSPKVLIGLLAQPGGAPVQDRSKIAGLLKRVSKTLGLVIKVGPNAKPVFMPYRVIQRARVQAKANAARPLQFGTFPAPKGSFLRILSHRFTAKAGKESSAIVARANSELTCDSSKGGTCRPWSDWRYYTKEQYQAIEPVKIEISELNPNTTFWVQRWRELTGGNKWRKRTAWVLGSSLPQVSRQLWKYARIQNTLGWVDAIISILTAATVVAGPLIALETGLASGAIVAGSQQAAIVLTKSLIKSGFWFVVTEALAQKLLTLDAKIRNPKSGYTQGDRQAWEVFKIGLLVLGGTLLLRRGWKALKTRVSPPLKAEIAALEKEMLKSAQKEAIPAAARAEGLAAAEAEVRASAQRMSETALGKQSQGRGLFGKQAPAPTGTISPELELLYTTANTKWFRFKLWLYAKLTGKWIDWDDFARAVASAEFREYVSWWQALKSGGYAGMIDGKVVLGMSKLIRKIPIIGKSSIQHELVHVYQQLVMGSLSKETAGKLTYRHILAMELSATFFGGPAAFVFLTGGGTFVFCAGAIYVYKKLS